MAGDASTCDQAAGQGLPPSRLFFFVVMLVRRRTRRRFAPRLLGRPIHFGLRRLIDPGLRLWLRRRPGDLGLRLRLRRSIDFGLRLRRWSIDSRLRLRLRRRPSDLGLRLRLRRPIDFGLRLRRGLIDFALSLRLRRRPSDLWLRLRLRRLIGFELRLSRWLIDFAFRPRLRRRSSDLGLGLRQHAGLWSNGVDRQPVRRVRLRLLRRSGHSWLGLDLLIGLGRYVGLRRNVVLAKLTGRFRENRRLGKFYSGRLGLFGRICG